MKFPGITTTPGHEPMADLTLDLDDPKLAAYLDSHSRGVELLRVAIMRGNKRSMVWLSISNFYGRPKVRMTTRRKLRETITERPVDPQWEMKP